MEYFQNDRSTRSKYLETSVEAGVLRSRNGVHLPDWGQVLSKHYNKEAFMFRHGLEDHAMLKLPKLIEVAKRLSRSNAYWSNGQVSEGDRWEKATGVRQTLLKTLENIGHNNSLVMLKSVIHDTMLGPLLRDVHMAILARIGSPLRDDLTVARATILIASPNRITPYHLDADVNFLMQISGCKQLRIFDRADRSVTSEMEIERFFAGDANGAVFKRERQPDSVLFDLQAGLGVHIPSLSPHWVLNGDDVSVALSFNYDLRSVERLADEHRMTARLRRIGLNPVAGMLEAASGNFLRKTGLAWVRCCRYLRRLIKLGDGSGWIPPADHR